MKPVVFMTYMCFMLAHTRRFYLAENFKLFWENPDAFYGTYSIMSLVNHVKMEMKYSCRRKRWLEGELAWDRFTADDLVAFLRKYDVRRRNDNT